MIRFKANHVFKGFLLDLVNIKNAKATFSELRNKLIFARLPAIKRHNFRGGLPGFICVRFNRLVFKVQFSVVHYYV